MALLTNSDIKISRDIKKENYENQMENIKGNYIYNMLMDQKTHIKSCQFLPYQIWYKFHFIHNLNPDNIFMNLKSEF